MQKWQSHCAILFSLIQPWNWTLGQAVTHVMVETRTSALHAQIASSRQALDHPPLQMLHWMNCLSKMIRAHALSLS